MNAVERFTEVKMSKNSQETRIALLEQSNINIQETLSRIDKRFDSIDKRFDSIDRKFDKVDDQFKNIRLEIQSVRQEGWSQMRWILIFMIGFMGSPIITALCKFIHIG